MSLELFDSAEFESINILPKDGELFYYPNFLSNEEADKYLKIFTESTDWQQDSINFGGVVQLIPRLQAWYGDPNKTFTYSGITLKPKPWTENLIELGSKLTVKTGIHFSSVLINLYRNGNDSVAWHADDEVELGEKPTIASISLGATRTFKVKHKTETDLRKEVKLEHGSLVIMSGDMQHKWLHSVPKEKTVDKPRINLTYRVIVSHSEEII